jgi:DNA-directed RNA polymerase subunit M/transcription elongation factor TFIIS
MPIKLPSFRGRRDAYPPDLWTKCPSCEEMLFNKQLDKVLRVCPSCGHHFRLSAQARLELLLDHGSFEERDAGLQSLDPLGFVDQKAYPDRIAAAQTATGMRDAAVWGVGRLAPRSTRRTPESRSSSCRPPGAPGCRKARSRSCSWPRRSAPSSACATRGFRT